MRRAFLIEVELDVDPATTIQDVAMMIDVHFTDREPRDFAGEDGCTVFEIAEAQPTKHYRQY